MDILAVGLGGFIGSVTRYLLTLLLSRNFSSFPLGTWVVNVLGCLLLGLMIAWFRHKPPSATHLEIFFTIGILGAFTTFSTFAYDTLNLFQKNHYGMGFANVSLNLFIGLFAVWSGMYLGTKISGS